MELFKTVLLFLKFFLSLCCFVKERMMVGVQYTIEQRTFMVEKYIETKTIDAVKSAFQVAFSDRDLPVKFTILYNVKKFQNNGTSHNFNAHNSGRRRTVRTPENVEMVREALKNAPLPLIHKASI